MKKIFMLFIMLLLFNCSICYAALVKCSETPFFMANTEGFGKVYVSDFAHSIVCKYPYVKKDGYLYSPVEVIVYVLEKSSINQNIQDYDFKSINRLFKNPFGTNFEQTKINGYDALIRRQLTAVRSTDYIIPSDHFVYWISVTESFPKESYSYDILNNFINSFEVKDSFTYLETKDLNFDYDAETNTIDNCLISANISGFYKTDSSLYGAIDCITDGYKKITVLVTARNDNDSIPNKSFGVKYYEDSVYNSKDIEIVKNELTSYLKERGYSNFNIRTFKDVALNKTYNATYFKVEGIEGGHTWAYLIRAGNFRYVILIEGRSNYNFVNSEELRNFLDTFTIKEFEKQSLSTRYKSESYDEGATSTSTYTEKSIAFYVVVITIYVIICTLISSLKPKTNSKNGAAINGGNRPGLPPKRKSFFNTAVEEKYYNENERLKQSIKEQYNIDLDNDSESPFK